MNGAQSLMRTLVEAGVEVCFTNPGTSEMHFVAALDAEPRMRAVLTLFEGVASGAADGNARMADKPAATLLHLGCGLGNALANLHNARKARVPLVNIVGDHASFHAPLDAPLQSDIDTVARNVSTWIRRSAGPAQVGQDAAEAVAASFGPPGQVATLILPADASWGDGGVSAPPAPRCAAPRPDAARIDAIALALAAGPKTALLLGGRALREGPLRAASQLAAHTGVQLLAEVFPTRLERGAGLPPVQRLAYLAELAGVQLAGLEHLVLVDAKSPVSFFAYPGKPSELVPPGCQVHTLAAFDEDVAAAMAALVEVSGAAQTPPRLQTARRPPRPRGKFTADKVCKAIGHLLPEGAIVVDEAQTSGLLLPLYTAGAPRHDLITLTGGAIGQGLPNAVGAAIACPTRKVIALSGDGSALYTPQALWTMARERLDVVSIIFNNRAYAILNMELQRVGALGAAEKARAQFDLRTPPLDFVQLAQGQGVKAVRATDTEGFVRALEHALATPGPHLIEAVVPPTLAGVKLRLLPHLLQSLASLPQPLARALKRSLAP